MSSSRPPGEKPDKEMRIALYAAARAELLERMKLRDQALFGYVVLLGGYFGFALSLVTPESRSLGDWREIVSLFALPGASIIFALIVAQHHVQISELARFISDELLPDLEGRHWDSWCADRSSPFRTHTRRWAQTLALALPSLYVLFRLGVSGNSRPWNWLDVALALFAAGAILFILWCSHAVEVLRGKGRKRIRDVLRQWRGNLRDALTRKPGGDPSA